MGDTVDMGEPTNKELQEQAVAAILTRIRELAVTAEATELPRLAEAQRYLVDESEVSYGFVGTHGLTDGLE